MNEFAALRLCEFYFEVSCRFVAAAAGSNLLRLCKVGQGVLRPRRCEFFTDAEGGYL